MIESGAIDALYARSFHFSFVTALTILRCKARLAVTETPLEDASDNGMVFSLYQMYSYCLIIYLHPSIIHTFARTNEKNKSEDNF